MLAIAASLCYRPRVYLSPRAGGICIALFTTLLSVSAAPIGQTRTVSGHVPAAVSQLQPLERLPADRRLSLAVGLPLRDPVGLTNFLAEIYNPSSPRYRQYLTSDQFTEQFGPTEQDFQAVITYLTNNGFTVTYQHPNRMIVDVSGTVAAIEQTFQVKMQSYQHPTEVRTFFAPDTEPIVDAAIPILHMSGLNDYVLPRPASLLVQPADRAPGGTPLGGSGSGGTYRGSDFRTAYAPGISANLNGTGQMVGLLQFDGYFPADIAAYESLAGLPNVPLINVLLDDIGGGAGGNNIEVALDIEMCVSMAPGLSAIIVYEGGNGDDILGRMATDNIAKQLSASWTFGIDAVTEQIFQQFAAQGQSYFNASGDHDAYSGTISTPSDDPNVISVGGTFLTTGLGANYSSERSWNRNNGVGTGGGISTTYTIPIWQQGLNMSTNQGSASMRNIPDVAMVADNVFIFYNNGSSGSVGGTSVASPLWAAFTSLINQQATARGTAPVGFLNPTIYSLGTNAIYQSIFHDIQTGSNTNSNSPALFFAVPGYDLCTGWGTPKGTNLINALAPALNAPYITNLSAAIVTESCPNGVLDPGETVTVNFSLQNIGGVNTSNLVVTLLTNANVSGPSGPQAYGVVTGGGPAVSQLFTFTAGGTCGSVVTATLQLQDGATSLGTLSYSFQTGVPLITFAENFDGVAAPALPAGWTTTISAGGSNWITTTAFSDTHSNAAFVFESALAGTSELVSPSVPITTTSARLTFRNFYNAETDPTNSGLCYDGGVLEIKIGAGSFLDIQSAGGTFIVGGYNKKIDPTDNNPLDGRRCWSGLSPGFITTTIKLPASAAGQSVQFKWRFGTDTDNAFGATGWFIDSVSVQDGFTCCTAAAAVAPAITSQPTNQTVPAGTNVTFSVTATGTAPLSYQWTFASTNLSGATNSSLLLTNVQAAQAGAYQVVVTNSAGSTNSLAANLRVLVPPVLSLDSTLVTSTNVSILLPSVTNLIYTLQYKSLLTDSNWISIPPPVFGTGGSIFLQDTNPPTDPARYYRVLVN